MRADGYRECTVTLIDLIGVKALAPLGQGSSLILDMHARVRAKVAAGHLPSHPNVYLWNDSILLLAFLDGETNRSQLKNTILKEADALKRDIDNHVDKGSYAISVQGMTFPYNDLTADPRSFGQQVSDQPDVVVIKASSWAFANCFAIEEKLGGHRADWYIDSTIAAMLSPRAQQVGREDVVMLPKKEPRSMVMYKGYLW